MIIYQSIRQPWVFGILHPCDMLSYNPIVHQGIKCYDSNTGEIHQLITLRDRWYQEWKEVTDEKVQRVLEVILGL